MKRPELLAPAGDYSCFQAALKAGADAVYLGGQQYGARAFAGNFSEEELIRALNEAHFYNKKIYLTVNTLMKQEELDGLERFIAPFYQAGLDGVIVQDVGALVVLKQLFPNLPLHASTQMTITDADGALALKDLGIERVVPARELSLKEIKELRDKSGMEVETFIHGAMCYCYSGQCLFSSFLGGRSGNRGRCAQPCRQPYQINHNGKECYPLSLKDMCTLPFIPELMDAGIDSFKIEGRMKKPEYVAGVTSAYRRRIDDYLNSGMKRPANKQDMKMLSSLYIRSSVSGGYYDKHNGADMITLDQPGYAGNDESVLFKIKTEILDREMSRPVQMMAVVKKDTPLQLSAYALDEYDNIVNSAVSEGSIVQNAKNRPLTRSDIEKQLKKTGGTGFSADAVTVEMDDDVFLPVKEINEMRRMVLEELKRNMISENISYKPVRGSRMDASRSFDSPAENAVKIHTSVSTKEQLQACLKNRVARVYIPYHLASECKHEIPETDTELFISLPVIMRSETAPKMNLIRDLLQSNSFDGVQISSVSALNWLKNIQYSGKIAFDHRIYIWNRETYEHWESRFDTYCTPLELNRRELFRLPLQGKEVMVYGRVPMMVTANCIKKTTGCCGSNLKHLTLTDRYQADFPVRTDCVFCYNTIFNSVPLSLHGYLDEMLEHGIRMYRMDFLDESGEETQQRLRLFSKGLSDKNQITDPDYAFTTGHYKKGAQ